VKAQTSRIAVTSIAGVATLIYFVLIILSFFEGLNETAISTVITFGVGLMLVSWGMFALTNLKGGVFNTQERWGLLDIYQPPVHPAYLDYVFSEAITTFMDPILFSQFDEYTAELAGYLNEGVGIVQAREKLIYLLYLNESKIISDEILRSEVAEVFAEEHLDKIIDHHFFSREVMQRVIRNAKKRILPMFRLVDRLQFNLIDNLEVFKAQPLYFDVDMENIVIDKSGNLFILLFNNTPEKKFFNVRVTSSDFTPNETKFRIALEGRGDFEITSHQLPLSSSDGEDVVGSMATILDIGDALWLDMSKVTWSQFLSEVSMERSIPSKPTARKGNQ